MKKLISVCSLALALIVSTPSLFILPPLAATIVATSGCKTANRAGYVVTGTAVVTVDAAMSAWGDYVKANHPPVSQEIAVRDAFAKYQAAALAVTSAGAAHAKILATNAAGGQADSSGALATLNAAISIASASLSDLIAAVQRFGAKI